MIIYANTHAHTYTHTHTHTDTRTHTHSHHVAPTCHDLQKAAYSPIPQERRSEEKSPGGGPFGNVYRHFCVSQLDGGVTGSEAVESGMPPNIGLCMGRPDCKEVPSPRVGGGQGDCCPSPRSPGGVRTQCTTGQSWGPPHSRLLPAALTPASLLWLKRNHGLSSTEVGTLPEKHPREAPRAAGQNGLTKLLLGSNIGRWGATRGAGAQTQRIPGAQGKTAPSRPPQGCSHRLHGHGPPVAASPQARSPHPQ